MAKIAQITKIPQIGPGRFLRVSTSYLSTCGEGRFMRAFHRVNHVKWLGNVRGGGFYCRSSLFSHKLSENHNDSSRYRILSRFSDTLREYRDGLTADPHAKVTSQLLTCKNSAANAWDVISEVAGARPAICRIRNHVNLRNSGLATFRWFPPGKSCRKSQKLMMCTADHRFIIVLWQRDRPTMLINTQI